MPDLRIMTLLTGFAVVGSVACQESPQGGVPDQAQDLRPAAMSASQEQLLLATAKVALPPEGIAPADLPDPSSSDAQLVAKHCAQCHALPLPTMHSAADWPSIVRRMWLRMDRLPDSLELSIPELGERVALLRYLTDNALRVSGASLPPGAGRETYAVACSRCHALPDPWIHSPQDWPAVFMRMELNMERMDVTPVTQAEASEILLYLASCCPPK